MSDISEQLHDCVNRNDLPDWKLVLAAAARIEKLEAALRNVAVTLDSEEIPYMVRNRYACATAKETLGDKNG